MFGRMNVVKVLELGGERGVEAAVSELLQITGTVQVVRWVEFPAALLVFLLLPEDAESGAVYVLDRRHGTWFWVDFEDERYGGYSTEDLDCLLQECQLLRLVERPGLLRSDLPWVVRPGCTPEAAV